MTSISSVPSIDGEVLGYLEAGGFHSPRITAVCVGAQSVCYLIGDNDRRSAFVLKRFERRKAVHSATAAVVEYEALRLFHEAASNLDGVSAPEPLLLLGDGSGYLMRYVDGQPLSQVLAANDRGGPFDSRLTARRLIAGLHAYHSTAGKPYYDFHPGNVLLDRELKVVMLDPTLPSPVRQAIADSSRLGFISADLGYWLHSLAITGAKGGVLQRDWWLLLRVTLELFQMAAEQGPDTDVQALLSDALSIAGKHSKSLLLGTLRRDVPMGMMALAVLAAVRVVSPRWIKGLGRELENERS